MCFNCTATSLIVFVRDGLPDVEVIALAIEQQLLGDCLVLEVKYDCIGRLGACRASTPYTRGNVRSSSSDLPLNFGKRRVALRSFSNHLRK